MTLTLLFAFVLLVGAVYLLLNFKRDIHIYQQNSYRPERYWRWLKQNFMPAWRLVDVALLLLVASTLLVPAVSGLVVAVALIVKMVVLLRAKYKKPLVFTKRVWRLYTCTGIVALAVWLPFALRALSPDVADFAQAQHFLKVALIVLLAMTIFSWVIMLFAAMLMTPVEKHINAGFRKDAMHRLASMPDLTVIGITGSFGKTSTKHYLHRILSEKYDTLMTPGSFNTPMGVIRTVREQLKPYHSIFICEMGAKQKGDIKEICDIVHPRYGIITAVGPMHLETFHSIDNVQSTKFELADALPADGLVVVNNDFEYCANRPVDNTGCVRYAVVNTGDADFVARDIVYTPDGTDFTVAGPDGLELRLHTQLIGECNISNLLAAVIMALRLGVEPERIKYAVSQIEQVEHRLNVKRTPGGVTIIDDAFNSNPVGSRMAVDALSHFTQGRRIIVTPGMIELGDKQDELNRALGRHIGEMLDIAIIVGQYNREPLLAGVRDAGRLAEEAIVPVDSFAEAQKYLATLLRSGDTVLYENDLPDTFK